MNRAYTWFKIHIQNLRVFIYLFILIFLYDNTILFERKRSGMPVSRAVQSTRWPAGTDQPDRNRPVTVGLTPPTGRWRVPIFRTRPRRVEWRFPSSKTRSTRPARQNLKRRPKSGDIWASQLRSGHGWPSFTQIRSNPHSDKLKSDESSPDQLKLGQTPVSSTLTRPNLVRSWPYFHRYEGTSAKSR